MNRVAIHSRKSAYALLLLSAIYLSVILINVAKASGDHGVGKGHAHESEDKNFGHSHDRDRGKSSEHNEHSDQEIEGFKLTPEAFKNFGIQLKAAQPGVAITLPKKAIFFGLQKRNLFRYRDGYFKRIDFKTLSKTRSDYTVSTQDLKSGDQIAVEGLGFLRIAELAASGGVAEGHSH